MTEPPPDTERGIVVEWSGPCKCPRPNCASKVTFPTRSSLRAHIKNIHDAPLLCTYPHCSYKKPFGKPCDLRRHVATAHNTSEEYTCLETGCGEVFTRRDKLMKHAKDKHQLFACPSSHCSATVVAAERESHLRKSHGRYECNIRSCGFGQRSYFTRENIKTHMRSVHRLTHWQVLDIEKCQITDADGRVFFMRPSWRINLRDCPSCSSKNDKQ